MLCQGLLHLSKHCHACVSVLPTAVLRKFTYVEMQLSRAWQPISLADFKTEGADLKGIYYLRNVVDADKIIAAIPEAKGRGGRVSLLALQYVS